MKGAHRLALLLSLITIIGVPSRYAIAVDAVVVLPPPLTEVSGDAERGRQVVLDRERGHCVLCHQVSQLDAGFQGNLGPDLSSVGNRLSEASLRQQVIDPTVINPNTVMPAYFRTQGLTQVAAEYRGETVLTAQEVEDVVAYLATLRGPADVD